QNHKNHEPPMQLEGMTVTDHKAQRNQAKTIDSENSKTKPKLYRNQLLMVDQPMTATIAKPSQKHSTTIGSNQQPFGTPYGRPTNDSTNSKTNP
ncbi:hypothetical protein U1Q18_031672, partial [Sarracenia purpurea var. burkii]